MSTADLARLSQLHYKVDKYGKTEAVKKINNRLADSDYKLESLKRGIALYRHKDGSSVLNSKGTNLANKKDIMSDIKLGLGLAKYDKQFQNRTKQIKNLLKKEPTKTVTLVGHSLGSSTITHAMAKSKSIRDNVKSAHGFNTGYTKLFNKELSSGLTPVDKSLLKKKMTHHHVVGDVISTGLTDRGTTGKVKKYDVPGSIVDKHGLDSFIGREKEATTPKIGPVIADV